MEIKWKREMEKKEIYYNEERRREMERDHNMIVEKIRRTVNKEFNYGRCGCCGFYGGCGRRWNYNQRLIMLIFKYYVFIEMFGGGYFGGKEITPWPLDLGSQWCRMRSSRHIGYSENNERGHGVKSTPRRSLRKWHRKTVPNVCEQTLICISQFFQSSKNAKLIYTRYWLNCLFKSNSTLIYVLNKELNVIQVHWTRNALNMKQLELICRIM